MLAQSAAPHKSSANVAISSRVTYLISLFLGILIAAYFRAQRRMLPVVPITRWRAGIIAVLEYGRTRPRERLHPAVCLRLRWRPISVPGSWMDRSAARALMDAMARLSLTVMSVRLLPASDIARSKLSSCSDQRSYCLRLNIFVVVELEISSRVHNQFRSLPSSARGCGPCSLPREGQRWTARTSR
jgi:hypothetical protein